MNIPYALPGINKQANDPNVRKMFCHSNNFASKGHPPTSKQSKIAFNLFAYPPRKRAKPGQKRARPFSLALFFFIFFLLLVLL
jgi:hypothetical protein